MMVVELVAHDDRDFFVAGLRMALGILELVASEWDAGSERVNNFETLMSCI